MSHPQRHTHERTTGNLMALRAGVYKRPRRGAWETVDSGDWFGWVSGVERWVTKWRDKLNRYGRIHAVGGVQAAWPPGINQRHRPAVKRFVNSNQTPARQRPTPHATQDSHNYASVLLTLGKPNTNALFAERNRAGVLLGNTLRRGPIPSVRRCSAKKRVSRTYSISGDRSCRTGHAELLRSCDRCGRPPCSSLYVENYPLPDWCAPSAALRACARRRLRSGIAPAAAGFLANVSMACSIASRPSDRPTWVVARDRAF